MKQMLVYIFKMLLVVLGLPFLLMLWVAKGSLNLPTRPGRRG